MRCLQDGRSIFEERESFLFSLSVDFFPSAALKLCIAPQQLPQRTVCDEKVSPIFIAFTLPALNIRRISLLKHVPVIKFLAKLAGGN